MVALGAKHMERYAAGGCGAQLRARLCEQARHRQASHGAGELHHQTHEFLHSWRLQFIPFDAA